MCLGCVILHKLHTSDGPESACSTAYGRRGTVCLHIRPRRVKSAWASVGVSATNGSNGGERLAFGVGGPLICSATAEVG